MLNDTLLPLLLAILDGTGNDFTCPLARAIQSKGCVTQGDGCTGKFLDDMQGQLHRD